MSTTPRLHSAPAHHHAGQKKDSSTPSTPPPFPPHTPRPPPSDPASARPSGDRPSPVTTPCHTGGGRGTSGGGRPLPSRRVARLVTTLDLEVYHPPDVPAHLFPSDIVLPPVAPCALRETVVPSGGPRASHPWRPRAEIPTRHPHRVVVLRFSFRSRERCGTGETIRPPPEGHRSQGTWGGEDLLLDLVSGPRSLPRPRSRRGVGRGESPVEEKATSRLRTRVYDSTLTPRT